MKKSKFVLLSLILIVFLGFNLFFVPAKVNGATDDIDPDLEYFWLSAGLPLSAIDFVDEDGKGIKFYVYSVDLDIPWVVLLSVKKYYFDDGDWINGEYYVFLEDAFSIFFTGYLYDVFAYYQVTYGSNEIIPDWDRMVIYWDVEKQVFDLVKADSDNWYTPDLEEYTFNIPAESEDFIFISHDLVTGNFAEFLTRQYDFGVSLDSTGALDFSNILQTLLWAGWRSMLGSKYGLTPMFSSSLPSYINYSIYNDFDPSEYKGAVNKHVIKYRLDFRGNYSMLLNDYIYDIVYSFEVVYESEIDYFDEIDSIIIKKGYIIHWYDTSEMEEYKLYTPSSVFDNLVQFQLRKIDNYENGYDDGWDDGWNVGHVGGYYTGYNVGYDLGYNEGLDEGYDQGYGIGHDEGYGVGYADGYEIGRAETYEQDYEQGYEQGYQDGEKSKIAKNNEIFYNRIAIWIPVAITVVALASIISIFKFKKNEE